MTRTLSDYFTPLRLIAALVCLAFMASAAVQDSPLVRLVGNWELSKINDPNVKRTIRFTNDSGQITGVFITSDSQSKTVTDIRFKDGAYSFRVPDLRLVFTKVTFINKNLEGEMIDDGEVKGRIVPQAIRMIRK